MKKVLSFLFFLFVIAMGVGNIVGGIMLTVTGFYDDIPWMIGVGITCDLLTIGILGRVAWVLFSEIYDNEKREA